MTAYRPSKPYRGGTEVKIRSAGHGDWYVTTSYRLVLQPTDTLARKLRRDVSAIRYVIPNLPGGYAAAHFNSELYAPRSCTITQDSPGSDVIVTASRRRHVSRNLLKSVDYRMTEDPEGLYRHHRQVRWTFSVEVPDGWEVNVTGQPTRQTKGTVTAVLTNTETVNRVELVPPGAPTVREDQATASKQAAASTTVAVVAVTGALLLHTAVMSGFPAATRRRWAAASAAGVTVTALGTVTLIAAAFSLARSEGYGWDWASWTYADEPITQPPYILAQQTLVTFSWLVLPLLVLAVTIRRLTGRPPGARALAPPALAGPALLVLETVISGFATWALLACGVAVASAAGVWGVQRSGTFGPIGRRWAAAGGAVTLAYVSGLSALILLPGPDASRLPDVNVTWGLAAWPTALAVVLPWTIVSMQAVHGLSGSPKAGKAPSIFSALVLACLVLPWDGAVDQGLPQGVKVLAWLTNLVPGRGVVSDVTVALIWWQVLWVAAAACLLYWLWSCGRAPGKWPDNTRTACMALIWLAATAPIVGNPSVHLDAWLSPVVAIAAYAGSVWLVPAGRQERAQRLHGMSRLAHVRLIHSLLRAQLMASSRHRFFRDSQDSLADGSLTPGDWDTRWNSLSAVSPFPSRDPAGQLLRLRYTALGSSGGYPPWRNGMATGAAALLLSLPWAVAQYLTNPLYDSLPELFTAAGGLLGLWWFSAFSYGYLHPWIRGTGPLGKAACVFVVVWPLQLGLLVEDLDANFNQAAVWIMFLTAQNTLVTLGLGLYWEARMVRAAGLPWGQIRNFRRLSSLAVPSTTVLVAAATAVATVLGSSWATSFTPPSDKPAAVVGASP
ncbi:hypothetical protein [Streptomyces sp. NPDC048720]|uniref:hypothetical protein n=1 Tax=Streptomyces sp. NPDC048720 TaxID=3365588 RepID=UPI003719E2F9